MHIYMETTGFLQKTQSKVSKAPLLSNCTYKYCWLMAKGLQFLMGIAICKIYKFAIKLVTQAKLKYLVLNRNFLTTEI